VSLYGNYEAKEGTVATETSLDFARPSRKIVVTNDSSTKELRFKFNTGEDFGTLRPTETFSAHMRVLQVIVDGDSVPYRVWAIG